MTPTQFTASSLILAEMAKSANSEMLTNAADKVPKSNPLAIAAVLGALGLLGVGGGLRAALPTDNDRKKGRGALKRFAIGAGQGGAVGLGAMAGGAFGRNMQDTIAGDDPVQRWLAPAGLVGGGLGMNALYTRAIGDR